MLKNNLVIDKKKIVCQRFCSNNKAFLPGKKQWFFKNNFMLGSNKMEAKSLIEILNEYILNKIWEQYEKEYSFIINITNNF